MKNAQREKKKPKELWVIVLEPQEQLVVNHRLCFEGGVVYGAENLRKAVRDPATWSTLLQRIFTEPVGTLNTISWKHE